MSIRSGHDEQQRDATTVHQQVSLASLFFPDPSCMVHNIEKLANSGWMK